MGILGPIPPRDPGLAQDPHAGPVLWDLKLEVRQVKTSSRQVESEQVVRGRRADQDSRAEIDSSKLSAAPEVAAVL